MRYFLAAPVFALVLTSCGSNGSSSIFSDSELSLDNTQTRFEDTQVELNANTTLTMVNKDFESPRRIENSSFSIGTVAAPRKTLEEIAVQKSTELFPEYDLRLMHIRSGNRFAYATFQQMYKGREVFGAKMVLRLFKSGDWRTSTTTLVHPKFFHGVKTKSRANLNSSNYFAKPHRIMRERSVYYPKRSIFGVTVHAATEFVLFSMDDQMEFWIWVDEVSGKAVGAYNPAAGAHSLQVKGTILPNAPGDELSLEVFPDVTAVLASSKKLLADQEGNFNAGDLAAEKGFKVVLENKYVSVLNNQKPDSAYHVSDPSKIENDTLIFNGGAKDNGPALEERNVYYWLMVARKFLHEKLNFDGMKYQLAAFTNYGERFDNAFFMPLMKTLSFGAGGIYFKNTALSRDIVVHEFGHAVTFELYGAQGGYEFGAMNEAFSDYFAAQIADNPDIGENGLLPALMQKRGNHNYLRTVENNLVYPKDFLGTAFHDDGQMFSGALWNLRKEIGSELADKMIHEARLAQAKTIQEFIRELLVIDERTDDGNPYTPSKNERAIWHAFLSHGLTSSVSFNEKKENLTTPWKYPKPEESPNMPLQGHGCLSFSEGHQH